MAPAGATAQPGPQAPGASAGTGAQAAAPPAAPSQRQSAEATPQPQRPRPAGSSGAAPPPPQRASDGPAAARPPPPSSSPAAAPGTGPRAPPATNTAGSKGAGGAGAALRPAASVPPAAAPKPQAASAPPPLPLSLLLGGLVGVAGLVGALLAVARRRRRRAGLGGEKGEAAAGGGKSKPGPCAKLKPTSRCVALSDGSGCVVRREIAADNSCLFNSVGYVMHKSKTRAPHLRNVVAQQVSGDRATYSDAFLGMTNEAYCAWIRQSFNWGGGIELSILAQAYGMEITAWNIESCKNHVFGEESGYKRQVMVIYNGVHYDALAVCASPRANPEEDETHFNPRTKRGKMVLAAARKLVELTHRESKFHGASKTAAPTTTTTTTAPAATTARSATTAAAATPPSTANSTSTAAATSSPTANGGAGGASPTPAKATSGSRVARRPAAAAAAAAAASSKATSGAPGVGRGGAAQLRCGDCGEGLADSAAAAAHAQATGHQNYEEVAR